MVVNSQVPDGNNAKTTPDKSLLDRLLEIKEWIGLGLAIVAAIFSSGGWVLTYFAKKEEVNALYCVMDVNTRLAKNNSSYQQIQAHQIQLEKELRAEKKRIKNRNGASAEDDDGEYMTVEDLKSNINIAKENMTTLTEDTSFFNSSLVHKECDLKENRDKLLEKLKTNPSIKIEKQ